MTFQRPSNALPSRFPTPFQPPFQVLPTPFQRSSNIPPYPYVRARPLRRTARMKSGPDNSQIGSVENDQGSNRLGNREASFRRLRSLTEKASPKNDCQDTYLKVAKYAFEISMLKTVCRPCANEKPAR